MSVLEELCMPIVAYIRENYNPYTTVTISADFIDVNMRKMGIPVKEKIGDQSGD